MNWWQITYFDYFSKLLWNLSNLNLHHIANRNAYFSLQSPGDHDKFLHEFVSSCEPVAIYNLIKSAYLYQKPGEKICN